MKEQIMNASIAAQPMRQVAGLVAGSAGIVSAGHAAAHLDDREEQAQAECNRIAAQQARQIVERRAAERAAQAKLDEQAAEHERRKASLADQPAPGVRFSVAADDHDEPEEDEVPGEQALFEAWAARQERPYFLDMHDGRYMNPRTQHAFEGFCGALEIAREIGKETYAPMIEAKAVLAKAPAIGGAV